MIRIMSEIESLLEGAKACEATFPRGAHLFHQDDPVRVVHVLREGAVQLRRHRPDGAFVVLQRAAAGDMLAEASVFAERYHCAALAIAPTRTRSVPVQALRAKLAEDPARALAFATHLAREVQAARLRAEILALRTVAERLDAWLAWQAGRLPERGGWQLLAGELGVTPEALYRELARRRRAGEARPRPGGAC